MIKEILLIYIEYLLNFEYRYNNQVVKKPNNDYG